MFSPKSFVMCSQAVLNVFCERLFEFHVATVSVECVNVACAICVFMIGFGVGLLCMLSSLL